ncbi:MAG TPA: type II secretion system protein N [Burkholderiaceae bacterium]|nr:type II secretion system protein N [Burkholderiaceae bacterium]
MLTASVACAVLGIGVGTVPFVPASYLQPIVERASAGRMVFAEANGTIWNGSARIAFASGGKTEARRYAALPGPVAWKVLDLGVAPPRLSLRLSGSELFDTPFTLNFSSRSGHISPGRVRLPAELLEAVGAPFNTLKPGGAVTAQWDAITWAASTDAGNTTGRSMNGTITLDWSNVRSALSPIAPLGAYRFTARLDTNLVAFDLATREGPLMLSGTGRWTAAEGTQFRGEAKAAEGREAELAPLISMLGPVRNGAAQLRLGS